MRLRRRSAISILSGILLTVILAMSAAVQTQAKVYTLKECIDKALKADLTVVQYKDYHRQAKADVLAAKGAFLPDLNWDLSGSRHRDKATSRSQDPITGEWREGAFVSRYSVYSMSLSASMTLFDFGRFANLARAKSDLSSYGHLVSKQELTAAYNVKSTYFSLLEAQSTLRISEKALERTQELMKIAQTKYELGSASLSDVLKAKVSLSQAQLDQLTAENAVRIAQANLNYAIGEPVDQEIAVEDLELSFAETTLEQANARALSNNPEYLSAKENSRSAKHAVRYARSDYFPSLSVGAAKSWSGPEIDQIGDWWNKDYRSYIGANLHFNIFNRFRSKQQTEIAKANLHTAEYDLLDTKRAVELEVREAHLKLQETIKARELSQEELESAQEDYKLAQEKYTLGAATILDILDAEVSLRTAESHEIESKYSYLLAIARLQKAMGLIE
jgi:outer membrane protein TolC